MAIIEKLSEDELILHEVLSHPVMFAEFENSLDLLPGDADWELSLYQKEFVCDFNSYVSLCCGRAVGKTQALTEIILWLIVNKIYGNDYIVYTVPSKVHLDPVFTNLVIKFKSNLLMSNYVSPRTGINSSSHKITALNGAVLDCRIAGMTGTGANVVGLHSPHIILDECVTARTKVATPDSNRRASELKPGDAVLSWDGEKIVNDRVVSATKVKREQRVLELTTAKGKVRVGENHRFYTKFGYIEAKDLNVGDVLFTFENVKRGAATEDEILFIKEKAVEGLLASDIAKLLNRTTKAVEKYIYRLGGLKSMFDEVPLTDEEYQILLGSFLGDGSAEFDPHRARYRTNHSLKQKEYVDWLHSKLERLTRKSPRVINNGGWGTLNYTFSTLGHKDILSMASELYIDNKKTVTLEYLNKLKPLGLAVWFMDDGSKDGSLSTHSFSYEENLIIQAYLKDKWGLESIIYEDKPKNLFFIYIKHSSLKTLRNIIRPYVPECMQYKLGVGEYKNELPTLQALKGGEDVTTLNEDELLNIRVVNTRAAYLYSIEVESNHNYFANGILTKNSAFYPWGTWTELQPTLNTFTPGFRMIVSGVPDGKRENSVCYYADNVSDAFSTHNVSSHDNPRYSQLDEDRNLQQFGGVDSEDYVHMVLGKHGSPTFSVFDRALMAMDAYPIFKLTLDGISLRSNVSEYKKALSYLPPLPPSADLVILGADLGYTDPTAIFIMYMTKEGRFKFHVKVQLNKVTYPMQEKIIDVLDDMYRPAILGIDEGSAGKSTVHHLMEGEAYIHKAYDKRLIPINFSSSVVVGLDADGKEISERVRPYSISTLQQYTNNHRIIYTSTDMETVSELERMTYTKSQNGDLVYRTLTLRGGQRGADHFTAALLCGILAYHQSSELLIMQKRPVLFTGRWM